MQAGADEGLSGSKASPRGALAGAGSQKQGLNVQDMSLVLALMLRKALGVAPVVVDIERFCSAQSTVGGRRRRRWRPGGRDHRGNASLFGAMPGPDRVEYKGWEGLMLSACD